MKFIRLFSLFLCIHLSANASTDKLEKVELEDGSVTSYEELLKRHKLTGVSFAVVDDYKVVYEKYVGEKSFGSEERIGADTAFSTASITKALVGTLLVMLDEQGEIDLDTPVFKYLKRWQLPSSELTKNSPITLRHLLSHTAGTTQHGFTDFYQGDDYIPTLIQSLNGQLPRYNKPISVQFKPGSNWKYSGGGYVIAQIALEDHLGKPLAAIAKERILEPLNMTNTTLYQHGDKEFLTNVAKVHDREQQVIKTGIPICPQIAPSGMWSTPGDMAKFVIEIQKALAGKPTKVISTQVAKRVTELQTLHGIGGWSMGWMRYEGFGNNDWFSHGGSNTGTGGHIMGSMEDGKAIMIFGNGPNPSRMAVINTIRDHIIEKMGWQKTIVTNKQGFSESQIRSLVGRYVAPFNDVVEIKQTNKGLEMVSQFFSAAMYPVRDNKFAMDEFANTYGLKTKPDNNRTYITYFRSGTDLFSYAMLKLNKNEKLPEEIAEEHSVKDTLQAYKKWQVLAPTSHIHEARTINRAGYKQLREKDYKTAITLLTAYTLLYPEDANAFDSLGEAHKLNGDIALAKENYKMSLKLNPDNEHAKKVLSELGS